MRNANFQALPQIYRTCGRRGLAICVLTSSPANSDPHWSLRTTDAAHEAPDTHHPVTRPFHPFLDLLLTWPLSGSSPDCVMLILTSAVHPPIRASVLGFIRALIPDLFLFTLHPLHRQSHLPLHTVTDISNPFYITGLYNYKSYAPSWQIHKHTFHRTSCSPPRTPD